jgi:ABC-type transport system involved in cytochrome bd biosynthesis fused ATPase/permease subunit
MALIHTLSDQCIIIIGLPDKTLKKLLCRKVIDRPLGYLDDTAKQGLSGGQMQRLAVARTFMRSSTMEQEVGLLLFDEPSASLDPAAEHGTVEMSVFPFDPESSSFF